MVLEQNAELTPGWTYSVRADVAHTSPPIWRQLALPGEITLGELHDVLQASFGWDNGHLHMFTVRGTDYSSFDADSGDPLEDEDGVTLRQLVNRTGQKFTYLYDFGDSWEIRLKVEKIDRTGAGPVAVCVGGRRGGPFEDSGGIGGYENMCTVLADPNHPEHEEVAEWLGFEPGAVTFDPAVFDVSALNLVLAELPAG